MDSVEVDNKKTSQFNGVPKYWRTLCILFGALFIILLFVYFNTVKTPTSILRPTTPPTPKTKLETYKNDTLKMSFDYPLDWTIKTYNEPTKIKLCDLSLLNPSQYPTSSLKYGACEGSGIEPTGLITRNDLLNMNPAEISSGNSAISLFYYENPDKLSIQDFNEKYLSASWSGDPVIIWSPAYEEITNQYGITAYYDKEHYCVSICQIYVWANNDKIFILKNFPFPFEIPTQLEIFNTIFNSLRFDN